MVKLYNLNQSKPNQSNIMKTQDTNKSLLREAEIIQVKPQPKADDKHILVTAMHGSKNLNARFYFHTKKSAQFSKERLEDIFKMPVQQIAAEPDALSGTKVRYLTKKNGDYTDIVFYPHSTAITPEETGELFSEL